MQRNLHHDRDQRRLWTGWERNRPGEPVPVVRRHEGELKSFKLNWALKPTAPDGRRVINVRSEGRAFNERRCLVPAEEFVLRDRSIPGTRRRVTLPDGDNLYLAGIWRPVEDWPEAFAVLTTAAGPDVAAVNDRQLAVVPRRTRGVARRTSARLRRAGTVRRRKLRARTDREN